jgi:chromosomal replication initiation ATPase DnaA
MRVMSAPSKMTPPAEAGPRDGAQQRRFAGAVGAYKRHQFVLGHAQVHRLEGADAAVVGLEPFHLAALEQVRVLVGGTGTGKTHLAIAIARSCIRSGAHGRFYNVVDLVNRLETETRNGRQGRIADQLTRMDFIILDRTA